jgi:hypothetical protein
MTRLGRRSGMSPDTQRVRRASGSFGEPDCRLTHERLVLRSDLMRMSAKARTRVVSVVVVAGLAYASVAASSGGEGVRRCRPDQLRGSAGLQGATGSQLGGVLLTNRARTPCVLPATPPRVSLTWRSRRLAVRQLAFPRGWLDSEYPRGSRRMGLLPPGQSTYVVLQWWNWCGPRPWGRGYFRGVVEVRLPGTSRSVVARLLEVAAPYCNAPPSTLRVSGFLRPA